LIKVNPIGPWRQLRGLLRKYDQRVIYVQNKLLERLAEIVVETIKKRVPDDPEYKPYIESLHAVQLTGTGKQIIYGVVADRKKVKVGELLKSESAKKTVVYVNSVSTGQPYEAGLLMAEANPWPIEMLPNGLDRRSVILVHQIVSDGEYKYCKENVTAFIRKNSAQFSKQGIKFGKIKDDEKSVESMESLPDWMSLAIRTEFGINAKQVSHWKPTLRWADKRLAFIMKDDEDIQKALYDPVFRGHLLTKTSNLEQMKVDDFNRETSEFQKKVLGA